MFREEHHINFEPAPLLEVDNLIVRIRHLGNNIYPVNKVSFNIQSGETLALVGESGSGKTLTSLAILGLLPSNAQVYGGLIRFKGKVVNPSDRNAFQSLRGQHISIIFQEPTGSLNPVFGVGKQVRDVVRHHLSFNRKKAKLKVMELFHSVGFTEPEIIYGAYPHQLSGGMAQRVMIAMALSCKPELIIADEPTSALDMTTQWQILRLLYHLQTEHNFALLLITHDVKLAINRASKLAVMKDGVVLEQGSTQQVLETPKHLFTSQLLESSGLPHFDEKPAAGSMSIMDNKAVP